MDRQGGNPVKHLFVQHPHLVARLLIEGAHLDPESVQTAIYVARQGIHFRFDSVQPLFRHA